MGKFYGAIGFAETSCTSDDPVGVWTEKIVEHMYCGDFMRNNNGKHEGSGGVNDDIRVANDISVVADPYALQNFLHARYIILYGSKWKISNVEVAYPRLIISIGGVYNGESE